MITDTEEGKALQAHIDRRETFKASIAAAQEKADRLLKYAKWQPDADDIESSLELNLGLDWHWNQMKKREDTKKMITDNTTENDLLAETIEGLGQSLTELQQIIDNLKIEVNYREED